MAFWPQHTGEPCVSLYPPCAQVYHKRFCQELLTPVKARERFTPDHTVIFPSSCLLLNAWNVIFMSLPY